MKYEFYNLNGTQSENTKSVNSLNKYGETALMSAVRNRNIDGVKELLKNKYINVNYTNKEDLTALDIASIEGYSHIVKELLKHKDE